LDDDVSGASSAVFASPGAMTNVEWLADSGFGAGAHGSVICIVQRDFGAGRKLNRVPAVTAFAQFASIVRLRGGRGLHQGESPGQVERHVISFPQMRNSMRSR